MKIGIIKIRQILLSNIQNPIISKEKHVDILLTSILNYNRPSYNYSRDVLPILYLYIKNNLQDEHFFKLSNPVVEQFLHTKI